MILHICSDPEFLEIMVILKQAINIMKIAAPLALIIMMMLDVLKSVMASDYDGIKKGTKQIPRRLVSAAMIFFVPTILEFTLNLIDESVDYATCITNADYETIENLYIDRADTYVVTAEQSLKESDLISARGVVSVLTDETLKKIYNDRLNSVEKAISDKRKGEYQNHETATKNNFNNSAGNVVNNNNFPYYNQCDSRWKKITLLNGSVYNTCNSGCGYTALSMVISGLKSDTTITPNVVVPYVKTFSSSQGAISDSALYNSNIKSRYGVTPHLIFGRGESLSETQKKDKIVNELRQKKAVVLLIPGHYIALTGINGNNITVLDPGRASNNGTYTIDSLYSKYYNYKDRCTTSDKCGFILAVSYSK